MPNWRWQVFLDKTIEAFSEFQLEPYPIDLEFLDKEGVAGPKARRSNVKTSIWACQTFKISKLRAVCVNGENVGSVLNLVIKPAHNFDLPFFGADFVTLPGGHLLALDLQPVLKNDRAHTESVWKRLVPIHQKWQSKLPFGGAIPVSAEPFFSPGFLWTRLPLGEVGEKIIDDIIQPAFEDYLSLYLDLVHEADEVLEDRSRLIYKGQRNYLSYRAENDPARGMLTRFYGNEWTEKYIHQVLFD